MSSSGGPTSKGESEAARHPRQARRYQFPRSRCSIMAPCGQGSSIKLVFHVKHFAHLLECTSPASAVERMSSRAPSSRESSDRRQVPVAAPRRRHDRTTPSRACLAWTLPTSSVRCPPLARSTRRPRPIRAGPVERPEPSARSPSTLSTERRTRTVRRPEPVLRVSHAEPHAGRALHPVRTTCAVPPGATHDPAGRPHPVRTAPAPRTRPTHDPAGRPPPGPQAPASPPGPCTTLPAAPPDPHDPCAPTRSHDPASDPAQHDPAGRPPTGSVEPADCSHHGQRRPAAAPT